MNEVTVSGRGARRWSAGHPWIYRSDVRSEPASAAPGLVRVRAADGSVLGQALYSPVSEIRLRMLTAGTEPIDATWWCARIREALARRNGIDDAAYRIVHAEADGLPSLVIDRYDRWACAQLLSAGLEACRGPVLDGIREALSPEGLLLRHDVPVRRYEELPLEVELAFGDVPREIDLEEGEVHYRVDPWSGQKTGAYLDQRENRILAGASAHGRALDLFCYEGAFALHLARNVEQVVAVDQSEAALARGRANAELNGLDNIEWRESNAFDTLHELEDEGVHFDRIVLDPPAFAKSKASVDRALRGYKEINLRAMRLLEPGGRLFTFSCSYHVGRDRFLTMLADAAADSGRRVALELMLGPARDHPELLTIPETGYLKGALLHCVV